MNVNVQIRTSVLICWLLFLCDLILLTKCKYGCTLPRYEASLCLWLQTTKRNFFCRVSLSFFTKGTSIKCSCPILITLRFCPQLCCERTEKSSAYFNAQRNVLKRFFQKWYLWNAQEFSSVIVIKMATCW